MRKEVRLGLGETTTGVGFEGLGFLVNRMIIIIRSESSGLSRRHRVEDFSRVELLLNSRSFYVRTFLIRTLLVSPSISI